jgi:putative oxidoreductase
MNGLNPVIRWHAAFARQLDHLRSPLLLATRLWVSWQFLNSGWLKLTTWDVTLELFREYHVPPLPPGVARSAARLANCFFRCCWCRIFNARRARIVSVNAMAVISYWHVLGSDGYSRLRNTCCGVMLAVIACSAPVAFRSTRCSSARQRVVSRR